MTREMYAMTVTLHHPFVLLINNCPPSNPCCVSSAPEPWIVKGVSNHAEKKLVFNAFYDLS
jgi:hypothetical protein